MTFIGACVLCYLSTFFSALRLLMTDLFLELRKRGVIIFPYYEEIYQKSRFLVQQIIYALIDCFLKVPVNNDLS